MTSSLGPRSRGAARVFSRAPRRVLSAFLFGLALSVAGLVALASQVAGARGPFVSSDYSSSTERREAPSWGERAERAFYEHISFAHYSRYAASRYEYDDEDYRPRHRHKLLRASVIKLATVSPSVSLTAPVCVRLCDGFFFPLPTSASDVASQGSACNSLCPDAPTEVYYRNGDEKIENSVSPSGKLYSALPVSLRYRAASDETCSCHRSPVAYAPLRDATLKHGDAIMTPAGFMVFHGVEGAPHGAGDFAALAGAGLGAGTRGAMQDMERVSLQPLHPSLKAWLLSQNAVAPNNRQAALSAPTQMAMRAPSLWRAPSVSGGGKIRFLGGHEREE